MLLKYAGSEYEDVPRARHESAASRIATKVFKVRYMGRVGVTAHAGLGVVEGAKKRLKKEWKQKPYIADLHITPTRVTCSPVKEDGQEVSFHIKELSFTMPDARDKSAVSMITVDRAQQGVKLCHFYQCIRAKGEDVNNAIMAAFKATALDVKAAEAKNAPTQRKNSVTKETDASRILGNYQITHLGSQPFPAKTKANQAGVEGRLSAAVNEYKQKKFNTKKVLLTVSGEGIKVVDKESNELQSSYPLLCVLYTTVTTEKKFISTFKKVDTNIGASFAIIIKNDRLKQSNVELFSVNDYASGQNIVTAISRAFEIQVKINELRKGNPFAAISSQRQECPKDLKTVQFRRDTFEAGTVLGMGQFGEVYQAFETQSDGTKIQRAVKIMREGASREDRDEFLHEAEVMTKFDHENLVKLIGVAVQQMPWMCALEFIKYGDLQNFMKTAASKKVDVTEAEMVDFALQIAKGMDHLASKRLIHMDLAARNVLLHDNNLVKVADFGITKKMNDAGGFHLKTTLKLPVKWLALEILCGSKKFFSEKSDVWAFGVTIWEIFSYGKLPYDNINNTEVSKKLKSGYRLEPPKNCPAEVAKLLTETWSEDAIARPSFAECITRLDDAAGNTSSKGQRRDIGKVVNEAI